MPRAVVGRLRGGDRRSIGAANQVADAVGGSPAAFRELVEAMWHSDEVVRMRAADAAEKASREHPEMLVAHKQELLGLLAEAEQQELRWHLAPMVSRLDLNRAERRKAAAVLKTYLDDRSSIVKTFAMQALADLAGKDDELRAEVLDLIRVLTRNGTAAMRARGRKLLKQLELKG